MRTVYTAAALIFLAGCDNGGVIDQTIQNGVRQSAIQACMTYVPQSNITLVAGLDSQQLCACAVDRMVKVGNVADLTELRPDSAEGREAIAKCITQVQSAAPAAQPS